ncbi:MAG: aminotransferase class IV [Chloroflexi bacterium]|nr:aminotransferase class IV [Chloroflexota bacterium]
MIDFQLFAMLPTGPQPLPTPPDVQAFADLYAGLSLGVYSAWRTFRGNKFLHLAAHLARTRRSMALLGWECELDETAVRRALHTVCSAAPYPEMRVRLDVLAEPARSLGVDSRILLALMSFTPPPISWYEMGVSVGIARGLEREWPLAKTADFAAKRRSLMNNSVYEHLILDKSGRILEGTGSNFYAVRDGAVWTAGAGILEGITRQIILDLLPQLGIPLRLEPVNAADILALDEAAISSSSRGWLPVTAIDGQRVGDGRPGPISKQIMIAYNEYVGRMAKTAVNEKRET